MAHMSRHLAAKTTVGDVVQCGQAVTKASDGSHVTSLGH